MPGRRPPKQVLSSPSPLVSVPATTASSFPVEALTPCFRVMFPLWTLRVAWDATGRNTSGLDHALSLRPLAPPSPLPPPALSSSGLAGFGLNHVESHLLFNLIPMTNLFFCQEMMTLLVIPAVPGGKIN